MTTHGKGHGRLVGKTHRRHVIEEWRFVSPHRNSEADPLTATVRLEVDGGKLKFVAFSRAFPGVRTLEHTDISKLHDMVEEEFRRQDLARSKTKWENWIEIEIGGGYIGKDDDGASLTIEHRPIKRGVNADTSDVLTINFNNIVTAFPSPKRAGEEDPDTARTKWGIGARDKDHQFAYIKATRENVAAINSVCERLRELRGRLNLLLEQDNLTNSLASVHSGLPLLSGPHI